jgi:hypothetical protein
MASGKSLSKVKASKSVEVEKAATGVTPCPAEGFPPPCSRAAGALRTATAFLEEEVLRCVQLRRQVEEAFGGQPFLPDASPTSPENRRRYTIYLEMLRAPTRLMTELISELLKIREVEPDTPYPLVTGAKGTHVVRQVTEDALLLAEHLTLHAHTFKKPLPPFGDAGTDNSSKNLRVEK